MKNQSASWNIYGKKDVLIGRKEDEYGKFSDC